MKGYNFINVSHCKTQVICILHIHAEKQSKLSTSITGAHRKDTTCIWCHCRHYKLQKEVRLSYDNKILLLSKHYYFKFLLYLQKTLRAYIQRQMPWPTFCILAVSSWFLLFELYNILPTVIRLTRPWVWQKPTLKTLAEQAVRIYYWRLFQGVHLCFFEITTYSSGSAEYSKCLLSIFIQNSNQSFPCIQADLLLWTLINSQFIPCSIQSKIERKPPDI